MKALTPKEILFEAKNNQISAQLENEIQKHRRLADSEMYFRQQLFNTPQNAEKLKKAQLEDDDNIYSNYAQENNKIDKAYQAARDAYDSTQKRKNETKAGAKDVLEAMERSIEGKKLCLDIDPDCIMFAFQVGNDIHDVKIKKRDTA